MASFRILVETEELNVYEHIVEAACEHDAKLLVEANGQGFVSQISSSALSSFIYVE